VLFWLSLIVGILGFALGVLWIVSPRVFSERLPAKDADVWTLPRVNGMTWFLRLFRWLSRKPLRGAMFGALLIVDALWFVWSVSRSRQG